MSPWKFLAGKVSTEKLATAPRAEDASAEGPVEGLGEGPGEGVLPLAPADVESSGSESPHR